MALSRISAQIFCNGYYLFVIGNDMPMVAHARMFVPAIEFSEDPVRGNGAGPLGAYIVAHRLTATNAETFRLSVRQGEAMGRPGQVDVCVDRAESIPLTVRVSGRAVVGFQSELVL